VAGRLAILACDGALPVRIAEAYPDAMQITIRGIPSLLEATARQFELERIGTLFKAMKDAGVTRMVFAGSLSRPPLNPAEFDAEMMAIAPRLMMAIPKGDDALLRQVMEFFEEQGFAVVGAHDLLPELVLEDGFAAGPAPGKTELSDARRAIEILAGISPLDLGQGCVVAGGQCLGIETVQGTDALLRFVAQTPENLRRGFKGVYVKAAKRGQDLRIDMPTIGPRTVESAAAAGLAGLIVEAGQVVVLDRDATRKALAAHGLFLIAQVM